MRSEDLVHLLRTHDPSGLKEVMISYTDDDCWLIEGKHVTVTNYGVALTMIPLDRKTKNLFFVKETMRKNNLFRRWYKYFTHGVSGSLT